MAGSDESRGARMRDPGTMRQNVEQLYRIWEAAPNNKKAELLLKGPSLAWAESWVLSNGQCEPGLKHYITRSISRSAAQSAAGRAVAETEELSKESRLYWAVIAMAAFTVTTLLPPLVKEAIDRAGHPQNRPVASIAKPELAQEEPDDQSDAQKEIVVTTVTVGPNGPIVKKEVRPAASQKSADGFSFQKSRSSAVPATAPATPGSPGTGGRSVAATSAEPRLPPKPTKHKTELEFAMDRFRDLGRLSQIALDRGEQTIAAQIALEAVMANRARPALTSGSSVEHEVISMLYRTLATRAPLLPSGDAPAPGARLEFCKASDRAIGLLADGRLEVWSPSLRRRLGSFESGSVELGRYLAPDFGCTRAVFESEDYAVQLVSVAEGKKLVRLHGHEADVSSAEFSNDGTKVITTSFDATARVWDARTGRTTAILRGHEDRVLGARLSPDGRLAVTWSEDRTARLWDAASGRAVSKLEGHLTAVSGASFLPDGRRILTNGLDGQVRVWSAATGKFEATLETQSGSVLSMEISRDGRRLATALQDSSVMVWDTASNTRISELKGGNSDTAALAFSPDAKLIATLSWRGEVALWEAGTGRKIASLGQPGDAAASLAFSEDGSRLEVITQAGGAVSWPTFENAELMLKYAMSTTPCLSPEQRENMHMGRGPSPWCAQSSERADAKDERAPAPEPVAGPDASENAR